MVFEVCLDRRPAIAQTGLSIHGYRRREEFMLHGLWGLHVYLYGGELRLRNEVFPFTEGSVSLTPPDTALEWSFPEHAPHYYVHFQLEDRDPPDDSGDSPEPGGESNCVQIPIVTRYDRDFTTLVEEMETLSRSHTLAPRRAEVLLWDVLWRLADQERERWKRESGETRRGEREPGIPAVVQIVTSVIENELAGKLTVRSLAGRVGVSHNHLTNLFRRVYGTTVVEYIRRRRCRRAFHLLTRTSLSITSIAHDVGVPDLQHFNKMIRRELGTAPSDLRR
ncbi:MAG: AraC family transcriptional regulator [Spirochaetaceae bacterium]|nr:MAG: AraC family transcriptional regulator [Spirochaetaceae bacterium]